MPARCLVGDSTKKDTWTQALGGLRGGALLTDPPYCLLTRRRARGDERDPKGRKIDRGPVLRFENVREYRDFTRAWLTLAVEHLDPEAPLVVWTNLLGKAPILEVASALGYSSLHGEYVWGKRTREGNSGEELLRVVETALVLSRQPAATPLPTDAAKPWAVVAGYDDDGEAERWGSHPNHKPFSVLEPLLRTWTKAGQFVVDPFAGSGSVPAAALRLKREVVCMELVPEWASRVSARLAQTMTEAAA